MAELLGLPLDNVGYFVLDENLRPVSIGEKGELYISGTEVEIVSRDVNF